MRFRSGGDNIVDDVADKRGSTAGFWQLRRSCQNLVKALANVGDHRLDLITRRMGKRDQQAGLASVLSQAGDLPRQS